MTFKHYILTRFNLGLYSDNPHQIQNPDRWMEDRIALFEKYTLPSVQKQTNLNFTWVLAFDINTPGHFAIRHDPELPYLDIVVCSVTPSLWLKEQTPEADWLLTSRFDNDDMYTPTFVDDIQKAMKFKSEVIDVDYRAMDTKTGKQYTSNRFKANSPFLTLSEPWSSNITTALGRPHSDMPNYFEARKLGGYHAIQLIHGGNICNKINGIEI